MEVITVISGTEEVGDFTSSFTNSINLSDDYEIGLLSISHAPVCNITGANNVLYVIDTETENIMQMNIPSGFYQNSFELLTTMYRILNESYAMLHSSTDLESVNTQAVLRYKNGAINNAALVLELKSKNARFYNNGYKDNVLSMLKFIPENISLPMLSLNEFELESPTQIAFLYSSIVSNSLINDRTSRLLATVPIVSRQNEHCVFEIINPVFHSISTSSFIDISFQLRDISGEILKFTTRYPTILTLGIRLKNK